MSIVEEKRMNFAKVLKKACNDARNGTVMIVPTFSNINTDSVGLLREFNVDDNQDNTFPFIRSNSPSKMLSPSSQASTTCTESNSINNMDILSEKEYEELCSNKWLNSIGKEILCKQDITEDQDFLGIIGEFNLVEKRYTSDLSMFDDNEGKQNTIHCYPEHFTEQDFQDLSVYFVQDTARVTIQQEQHMDARFQPYAKWKRQSPEDILEKKERNRQRSKAYRLRKKLQLEALRREEEDAKIAAEAVKKKERLQMECLRYQDANLKSTNILEYPILRNISPNIQLMN